jgi:hypothetical protein
MKNFIFAMIALVLILAAVDICRSPHEDPSASPPTEVKPKEESKNTLPAADRRADAPCVNPEGFRNRMPDGVPERKGKPLKNSIIGSVAMLTTTTIPYFFYSSTYGLWFICQPLMRRF